MEPKWFYYGTVSKFLGEAGGFRFSPFPGAAFIEELSDLRPVGGIHIRNGVRLQYLLIVELTSTFHFKTTW